MDERQIENFMQFVTEHMSRFAAGLEGLRHRQDALEARQEELHQRQEELHQRQEALHQRQERFQDSLEALREHARDLGAAVTRIQHIQETQLGIITNIGLQVQQVASRVDKLAELQHATDGRLNLVISRVDELVRRLDDQRKPQ